MPGAIQPKLILGVDEALKLNVLILQLIIEVAEGFTVSVVTTTVPKTEQVLTVFKAT